MKGDSETIVNALKTGGHSHALFDIAIDDAITLSTKFLKVQFQHVRRQGNSLAHALARHAQHYTDMEV